MVPAGEPLTELVVTRWTSTTFRLPDNKLPNNYEFQFVRPGRIRRRFTDRDRLSSSATRQTSQLFLELFALERCRFIADHAFPHFQVQRISILDRSVLVFDQPDRTIEMALFAEPATC